MIRPNTEVITPPTASPFPPWSFAIATIPSMAPIIPGSHPIQQQSVREYYQENYSKIFQYIHELNIIRFIEKN